MQITTHASSALVLNAISEADLLSMLDVRLQDARRAAPQIALHLVQARVDVSGPWLAGPDEIAQRYATAVASRLAQRIRACDCCLRWGADRFPVIQQGALGPSGSMAFAARLLMLFSEPLHVNGRALPIIVKLGVAVFPQHARDAGQLLAHARTALQAAGDGAQRRCVHYDRSLSVSGDHAAPRTYPVFI